jgi:hypothetical protein
MLTDIQQLHVSAAGRGEGVGDPGGGMLGSNRLGTRESWRVKKGSSQTYDRLGVSLCGGRPRFDRNRHAWVRVGRLCVDIARMPREQRMPERWRYSIVIAVGFCAYTNSTGTP